MAKKPASPVKASTQSFVSIKDIKDDILIMEDFSASCVIEIGAVNFWLLSSDEQEAMIQSYAGLLNSLSFPIQILIISKKMDISSYLQYLNNKVSSQPSEKVRGQLNSYLEFIKSTVKKNTVLERRFFFTIPFSPLELGLGKNMGKDLKIEYVFDRAKTSLYPKRDHLLRLLSKSGLRATILQRQELVEIFFNLYNPSQTGRKLASIESYTDVIHTVKNE